MSRLASSTKKVAKQLGQDGRYQVIKVVEGVGSAQSYIAADTYQPDNPWCFVKLLQPVSQEPDGQLAIKNLFNPSAEIMAALGQHDRIAKLLDCLEVKHGFYLVQEFVEGQPLSAEIALGQCWNENQTIQMLQEVLEILGFVHLQGAIHCHLQPHHLIRRQQDKKLVLADLSTIKMLPTQFKAIQHQSGDIYALGLMAIQALTGLNPMELKNSQTGEIFWQQHAGVSDRFAAIINQMVRYNFQDRYKFTIDVVEALQALSDPEPTTPLEIPLKPPSHPGVKDTTNKRSIAAPATPQSTPKTSPAAPACPKKTSHFGGIPTAGVATSVALVSGVSGYLLKEFNTPDPGVATLVQAEQKYQAGELHAALTLTQSVAPESSAYPEAKTISTQWQQNWQKAKAQYESVKKAYAQSRWSEVVARANHTPNIAFWQQKMAPMVNQAQTHLDREAYYILQQAYDQAVEKDFSGALKTLQRVPRGTKIYPKVQEKISEYKFKRLVKADHLLQQAYNRAALHDFTGAIAYLKQIPPDTPAHTKAQLKIVEYTRKQQINLPSTH
ncbi:MAG TPA: hypothetical protein DDZ80_10215 [Cyanobacteria bacterium UBA8803]|nr:hypothetical protein [Cyanobacteria bacterium UBA9273]HBL58866.1 hypothetical protein [Cyanobacteria bacterium UBA8803]